MLINALLHISLTLSACCMQYCISFTLKIYFVITLINFLHHYSLGVLKYKQKSCILPNIKAPYDRKSQIPSKHKSPIFHTI